MRMSQQEKDKSRQRILASASRHFRERGLSGASLADVMKDAGMTHGGFYKHFDTKDDLFDLALTHAFDVVTAQLDGDDPGQAFAAYRDLYLTERHVSHPGQGCPAAALGGEVGRHTDAAKARFGAGVQRIVGRIAGAMPGSPAARQSAAYREFAMMVGAIVLARASDPVTARAIIDAARRDRPARSAQPRPQAPRPTSPTP